MAVTILERPKGYILGAEVSAEIVDAPGFAGHPVVNTLTSHGLVTGDIVYVKSNIEDYNGFLYVDLADPNSFLLKDITGTDYLTYIQDSEAVYYAATLEHGWSCVELPITYKLSNTLYPTNSVDTVRTITALTNSFGFAQLNVSGSLGTFEDLSFVKISNAPNSDLDGVYQIIDKLSTSSVILNIDYLTVTNATLLGASIQLYYGNYNIVVQVYAGINASHQWASQKPYELAATLELIPDENNEVFFSINDILKAYVKTENNLLLGTLPNNIDAWTNFYISTAEAYDTSNGYSVTTLESSFTSDQSTFEGTAVNAKLDFKNVYSGYMSEYLMENSSGKFLTLFDRPVLFQCGVSTPNCYSDISWISLYSIVLTIRKQYYLLDDLLLTVEDSTDGTSGVIRTELEADCDYDRVDISILQIPSIVGLASWLQHSGPGTRTWVIDAAPDCALLSSTSSVYLYTPFATIPGKTYTISAYSLTNSAGVDANVTFDIVLLDSSFAITETIVSDVFSSATMSGSDSVSPTVEGTYLAIKCAQTDVGATTVTVNTVTITGTDLLLSETKQFKIECGCSNQQIRLTWLNNLGGMEPPWAFTGETDHTIDITNSGETKKNIFPEWPKSYGEFADTIRKQTFRESAKREFIFSQFLTQDEADAIAYIKSSILVQIINSRQDRRTVIVDTDSFSKYKDGDKTYTISFNILYTDDIPSQTV